jgi:hypothetical protein
MRTGPWRMSPSVLADLKIVVVEDHDDAGDISLYSWVNRGKGQHPKSNAFSKSPTRLCQAGIALFLVRLLRLSLFW